MDLAVLRAHSTLRSSRRPWGSWRLALFVAISSLTGSAAAARLGGSTERADSLVDLDDLDDASEEEDVSLSDEESEGETEEASSAEAPLVFEAALGARLYSRSFRYTDTLAQVLPGGNFQDLPNYGLSAAPMPYADLTFYPLTKSDSKVLQNLGLTGGFEMGIGTDVAYGATRFSQTHYRYHVGVRGRIPLGHVSIQPMAEFGGHEFSLSSSSGQVVPFPSVNYTLIELGSDLVWRAHPLIIRASGKLLLPVGLGDVASANWFPSAKGLGSHFGGQVGLAVSPAFDVLISFDARIYGLNFNPVPDTATPDKVAGGATDQYVSVSLGLGYHLPSTPVLGD